MYHLLRCTNVKLSIRDQTLKLRKKSGRSIMETETMNKREELRNVNIDRKEIQEMISNKRGIFLHNNVHRVSKCILDKIAVVKARHQQKLNKLRKIYQAFQIRNRIKNTITSFPKYSLTAKQEEALSYSLEQKHPMGGKLCTYSVES